ncbi:hypothetical protein ACH5RR_036789 [Cinchona calisaya]|uniref:Uncharacterized protein n=1 Tax=Cinchona calisaya TaxID=153742 RepID=A0ABD2Y5Y0_9GENT
MASGKLVPGLQDSHRSYALFEDVGWDDYIQAERYEGKIWQLPAQRKSYVALWDDREATMHNGTFVDPVLLDKEYMQWCNSRTILYYLHLQQKLPRRAGTLYCLDHHRNLFSRCVHCVQVIVVVVTSLHESKDGRHERGDTGTQAYHEFTSKNAGPLRRGPT